MPISKVDQAYIDRYVALAIEKNPTKPREEINEALSYTIEKEMLARGIQVDRQALLQDIQKSKGVAPQQAMAAQLQGQPPTRRDADVSVRSATPPADAYTDRFDHAELRSLRAEGWNDHQLEGLLRDRAALAGGSGSDHALELELRSQLPGFGALPAEERLSTIERLRTIYWMFETAASDRVKVEHPDWNEERRDVEIQRRSGEALHRHISSVMEMGTQDMSKLEHVDIDQARERRNLLRASSEISTNAYTDRFDATELTSLRAAGWTDSELDGLLRDRAAAEGASGTDAEIETYLRSKFPEYRAFPVEVRLSIVESLRPVYSGIETAARSQVQRDHVDWTEDRREVEIQKRLSEAMLTEIGHHKDNSIHPLSALKHLYADWVRERHGRPPRRGR